MAKETSPTFVLKVKMHTDESDEKLIETELEINRAIYNTCLGELLKREKRMKRTKRHKQLIRMYRAISKKLAEAEKQNNKTSISFYKLEREEVNGKFAVLLKEFGVSEFSIHQYMNPIRSHFENQINVNVAQKTATRAWNTFKETMYGKANSVFFKRKGEMDSFEGKTNGTGWVYKNRKIKYSNQFIELKVKRNDMYLRDALHMIESGQRYEYRTAKGECKQDTYRVKYVRITHEFIRGKHTYYADLVCAGYPPTKKDQDGKIKHNIGKGKVGIDIGTSSVAVVSDGKLFLRNLGEEIKRIDSTERKIRLAQRAMDRSRRSMNPTCYNTDGTIKKGKKHWMFSKRYMKFRFQQKSFHRRLSVLRKLSHQRMTNELLNLGNEFYIEEMNFRALQKRAKKTEVSEKTGRFKRKKRFGKSIAHRAPALFVSVLEDKVNAHGGVFTKVNTRTFKASQYDHATGEFVKKALKERWHCFSDGVKVQRDLYSAFLLMNADKSGKKANQKRCVEAFKSFRAMHDNEVERIEKQGVMVLNSGIRLKSTKTALTV